MNKHISNVALTSNVTNVDPIASLFFCPPKPWIQFAKFYMHMNYKYNMKNCENLGKVQTQNCKVRKKHTPLVKFALLFNYSTILMCRVKPKGQGFTKKKCPKVEVEGEHKYGKAHP